MSSLLVVAVFCALVLRALVFKALRDSIGSAVTFLPSTCGCRAPRALLLFVVLRGIIAQVVVTTLAGSGAEMFADGIGTGASFFLPRGVTVDRSDNVIVADNYSHRIRKVTPVGVVTTLAGSGSQAFADGTGTGASFDFPRGVAVDSSGNVIVADMNNHRIRKVTPGGVVNTLAGSGTGGFSDGTGAGASFNLPRGVALDSSGNAIIADLGNQRIRKVSPGGVVTTLAGSGTGGFADGTGTGASFYDPTGVAVDSRDNVYVADYSNFIIRKVTPGGVVTVLAGTLVGYGCCFADGAGMDAQFWYPNGVAVDSNDNVIVADRFNNRIRKVTPGGVVSTLAGDGYFDANLIGRWVDGTGSAGASFYFPSGVAVDSSGNVIVADEKNNRIRKISTGTPSRTPTCTPSGTSSGTPSRTPSGTPTGTVTGTPTGTPSRTPSRTPSNTPTGTSTGTPTNSPSGTATPSVSGTARATPSPTPSPLTCAPGTFVAPGTYSCVRCPANAIAPFAGPTAVCALCPRPLVANANATACAPCPSLMGSNGVACAPCPADVWCEGGRELPCLLPGQCLGDLRGCRAGHVGFLCGSCAPRHYKAPTNFCTPCGAQLWHALPGVVIVVVAVACVAYCFKSALSVLYTQLLSEYANHQILLQLLWDQVVRLSLLNRLSLLALPAEFKWALAFMGLVFGFNTTSAAIECANADWGFAEKWGLAVGLVLGALLLALCADFYARCSAPEPIRFAQWRVWDAMDALLPLAVQASWPALSSVSIDGQARLLSEPATLFYEYPHYYIFCASICIVVVDG